MHSTIRKYCQHICKVQLEVLHYDKKNDVWYWDLPAMASICHDGKHIRMAKGYSHLPQGTKWNIVLRRELQRLGQIGGHSNKCWNIIGNCAEQHAGNNYMNKYGVNNLNNMYFTEAVRPRTMEVHKACENCKYIFPNI